MQITHEQLIELTSVVEDTVEYYCDQHTLSGELVWNVVNCLALAKLAELANDIVSDEVNVQE